jgi:tRNA modification GTPase
MSDGIESRRMSGQLNDTICAIATPLGEGGIGIVRLSGEKAVDVAAGLVVLRSGIPLASAAGHALHHADILDPADSTGRAPLDEALVAIMRGPKSYTGEDIVELQCHGGMVILRTVCEMLVRAGARLAEPGEFTKRAFLNGRLDLAQAEAVLDTIRAKTAGSLRIAQEQLRGSLSHEIDAVREALIGLLAQVEAGIDFVEEDIAFIPTAELTAGLQRAQATIGRLLAHSREGRILRDGVTAAIIGRPNVGKSSLLNALLKTDRAIVTAIPGTTRDVLEEVLNIRGIPVRLLDTAGIRDTADPVEQEGVRRSRAAQEQADLVLIVLDGSAPLTEEDQSLLREVCSHEDQKRLVVVNKTDLPIRLDPALLPSNGPDCAIVKISAKTGDGLDDLRDRIRTLLLSPDFETRETVLVTHLRHQTALQQTRDSLAAALSSSDAKAAGELIAVDLRAAIDALGEITGAVSTDDILDRIFREFCIGK